MTWGTQSDSFIRDSAVQDCGAAGEAAEHWK